MKKESTQIPRSFGTHSGSFHADEVTACALLLHFNLIDRDKIFRTRDTELLSQCEFVCDVGGIYDPARKLFDHHQIDYQGPLSSAGMVLQYLRDKHLLNDKFYEYTNRALVHGIDLHDNGEEPQFYGFCSFSDVIANFNSVEHGVPPEVQDPCFMEALDFVTGYLSRLFRRFEYFESCRDIVANAMEGQPTLLQFDRSISWLEPFFELGGEDHPAQFLIMPSGDHWKLRCLPPSYDDRMSVRTPLPESWAGLQDEELRKISGIDGAIFCHKGRFISVWKTKKDAIKAFETVTKGQL